jgi:peptidase C13-like protein/uncharacterized protein DUF4214
MWFSDIVTIAGQFPNGINVNVFDSDNVWVGRNDGDSGLIGIYGGKEFGFVGQIAEGKIPLSALDPFFIDFLNVYYVCDEVYLYPQNRNSVKPILIHPLDGSTDISTAASLSTGNFISSTKDATHYKTEWQISDLKDFSNLVFDRESVVDLTTIKIPDLVLTGNTTYYWRVRFYDSFSNISYWSKTFEFVTAKSGASKKAIVIAGSGPDISYGTLWDETKLVTNQAYLALNRQGYDAEHIYFLSHEDQDPDGDGVSNVNGVPTMNAVKNALDWASDAIELLIFITAHGGKDTLQLSSSEILSSIQLDTWLDELQMTMPGKVIFIYDACYSGSFVDALTASQGSERVIVSSALGTEPAWFSDGGKGSFSFQFWSSVFNSGSLYDSFLSARNMVDEIQSPTLDVDGDGVANGKKDKELAQSILIGKGLKSASSQPTIGSAIQNQSLNTAAQISLWVDNILSMNPIKSVWATIVPPSVAKLTADTPVTDDLLSRVELTDINADGRYEGTFEFKEQGNYKVNINAIDIVGYQALPIPIQITVNSEKQLTQIQVSQLYVSIFGRASEGEGNAYWCSSQSDMTTAATAMLATDPAKAYFGTKLNDNQQFVEFIYENTLGKIYSQDPEGIEYWANELAIGKSKGEVIATMISAAIDPQYAGSTAQNQFNNKVIVCSYTAGKITTVPDVNNLTAFVNFIKDVTHDSSTVTAAKAAVDAY